MQKICLYYIIILLISELAGNEINEIDLLKLSSYYSIILKRRFNYDMDYKTLYFRLFNNITDVIYSSSEEDLSDIVDKLIELQQNCEELYISSEEPPAKTIVFYKENA